MKKDIGTPFVMLPSTTYQVTKQCCGLLGQRYAGDNIADLLKYILIIIAIVISNHNVITTT